MFDIQIITIMSAFAGGVIMFLAPCTLPLVPAFIASMAPEASSENHGKGILLRTVMFCIGFSVVFVFLGVLSGLVGSALYAYKNLLIEIGALFIVIFGLSLAGVFQIPILKNSFQKVKVPKIKNGSFVKPTLLGAVFALGWTPCAGPLLASILLLASQAGTAFKGAVLLAIFSLGLATPFILTGALYAHLAHVFRFYEKYYKVITGISGLFLILVGLSLFFSQTLLFNGFGYSLYSYFGVVPMCTYF